MVGVSLGGLRRRSGGGVFLRSFCAVRSSGRGVSVSLGFKDSGVWAVRRRCNPQSFVGAYCWRGGWWWSKLFCGSLCCGTAVPWASVFLGLLPMPATMPVLHCIRKNGIVVVCIPF